MNMFVSTAALAASSTAAASQPADDSASLSGAPAAEGIDKFEIGSRCL